MSPFAPPWSPDTPRPTQMWHLLRVQRTAVAAPCTQTAGHTCAHGVSCVLGDVGADSHPAHSPAPLKSVGLRIAPDPARNPH